MIQLLSTTETNQSNSPYYIHNRFGGLYSSSIYTVLSPAPVACKVGDGGGDEKNGSSITAATARLVFPSFASDDGHVPSRIHPALRICIWRKLYLASQHAEFRHDIEELYVPPILTSWAVSTFSNPSTCAKRLPVPLAATLFRSHPLLVPP